VIRITVGRDPRQDFMCLARKTLATFSQSTVSGKGEGDVEVVLSHPNAVLITRSLQIGERAAAQVSKNLN
jgi:hypothetical protein